MALFKTVHVSIRAIHAHRGAALTTMVLTLLCAGVAAQFVRQKPTEASGAISGVIVDGRTGTAVANAKVSLSVRRPESPMRQEVAAALTDPKGRFVFVELRPSDGYFATVSKPGYLDYRSPAPIPVSPNAWLEDLEFPLTAAAQLEGLAVLDGGDPASGVQVRLWREAWVGGRPRLVAMAMEVTNDLGAFRFVDLQPGRYAACVVSVQTTVPSDLVERVAAAKDGSRATVDAGGVRLVVNHALPPVRGADGGFLTYRSQCGSVAAGGTSDALVGLEAGEAGSARILLTASPGFRVAGTVTGAARYKGMILRLQPTETGEVLFDPPFDAATTIVGERGEFMFVNVRAGRYRIVPGDIISTFGPPSTSLPPVAPIGWSPGVSLGRLVTNGTTGVRFDTRGIQGAVREWGETIVDVASHVDGAVLALSPPGLMIGRVSWSGTSRLSHEWVTLLVEPAWADTRLGLESTRAFKKVLDLGSADFAIDGVRAGAYFLRVFESDVAIRSLRQRGVDVTDRPLVWQSGERLDGFEVELTSDLATLSGQIGGMQRSRDDATVVIFPRDRTRWEPTGITPPLIRTVRAQLDGHYSITGISAGRYYVVAMSGSLPPNWTSPEFLQRLAASAVERDMSWAEEAVLNLVLRTIR